VAVPESNSMTPRLPPDPGEVSTPEDVATLYSWANLHGAKYRDFSASRAQAREEARLRAEEAAAEERRRQEEEAERQRQEEAQLQARLAAEAAEAARQAEVERLAEIARQAEAEKQAVLAAQEAQRLAAQQRVWQPESRPGGYESPFTPNEPQSASFFGVPSFEPAAGPAFSPYGSQGTGQARFPDRRTDRTTDRRNDRTTERARDIFAGQHPPQSPQPVQSDPGLRSPEYGQAAASQSGQSSLGRADVPRTQQGPAYQAPQFSTPQYPAESYPMPPQDSHMPAPWQSADARELREPAARPAWLAHDIPAAPPAQQFRNHPPMPGQYFAGPATAPVQTPIPMYAQGSGSGQPPNQPPNQNPGPVDDTLLGSRDRIANRWYALKSVFDPQAAPVEQVPAQPPARVPVLAVFSLAGGVGKTSLVASLGRALSSRGERVLLVDTAAYGLLPFFFGARDQRPGMLRTFNPPGVSADAPIQLVTLDPEGQPPERASDPNEPVNQDPNQQPLQPLPGNQDWLAQEVARYTRSANRVLIDLPTASGSTTRRVLRLAPVVLVPVLPDMNSVVSVGAIEAFFRHNGIGINTGGKQIMPYYVLNQFDYSLPLHLDVREILREQIGDRLLPFALRRSPAVSEALAEGMTVMDYAPTAVVAEDYANLAGWVRSLSAPATQSPRGVRWSER